MTERQRWVHDFLRMFEAGQLSGELTIRFRDGVPVEAVPAPRYKPPQAGRRASESKPAH
jgi:hypothetical protein